MMRRTLLTRMLVVAAMTAAAGTIHAEIVGTTLVDNLGGRTIFATAAPGRDNELFVIEQQGIIHRLDLTTGQFDNQPFLDIRSFVNDDGGEQGLLGLAFDPDYETNGFFYVNYTRAQAPGLDRTRIDRFQAPNPLTSTIVSSGTRSSVLEFDQDFSNHNGGWIGFSPNDDYLYIATGDGGSGNDPFNRSQDLGSRLGKILRVDVAGDDFPTDAIENYRVPADNPFANDNNANTRADIWAYGLRNPYRASFDRDTGDLWIGDVGQDNREEIDFLSADSNGGENYGWRLREGDIATPTPFFNPVGGPRPSDAVDPVYDYLHGFGSLQGSSVLGGYVYRGPDPEVDGRYFFADTISSNLWTFDPANPDGTVLNVGSILDPDEDITTPVSFAEDAVGNLYVLTLTGGVYRIDTDALQPGDFDADGEITGDDVPAWAAAFGAVDAAADSNGDGFVTAADYVAIRDFLPAGSGVTEVTLPVPEPVGLGTVLIGAAGLLGSRRVLRL